MKLKKIILLIFFLGGIFYSSPARSETKYLPYDKCSPPCLQYEFCEMTPHPGKEATYNCEKRFADGVPCEDSVQCQSGNCGIGQGNEKKCMPPFAQETGEGYLKFAPIKPILEIKIPTLQPFTTEGLEKPDAEGNIYFPFIGQYIVGIYKWMLLVAGIVATIMIILGGFTYLTSGGNATRAGEGRERIGAAIFGLILLLGSYMLLYLINPGLVEFRSLKIKVVEKKPIESMIFESHGPAFAGATKALETTNYDETFKSFANCAGIDWKIYKAIAYKESGLNTNASGGKSGNFVGLFQVYQPYCKNVLQKVKWESYCDSPGLTNPAINNGYAALLIDNNAAKIEGTCAAAPISDKLTMLYIGHNCGPGALGSLLKTGCEVNKWLTAPPGNCSSEKMNFAKSVAGVMEQLGVSSIKMPPESVDTAKCPFNSGLLPQ